MQQRTDKIKKKPYFDSDDETCEIIVCGPELRKEEINLHDELEVHPDNLDPFSSIPSQLLYPVLFRTEEQYNNRDNNKTNNIPNHSKRKENCENCFSVCVCHFTDRVAFPVALMGSVLLPLAVTDDI